LQVKGVRCTREPGEGNGVNINIEWDEPWNAGALQQQSPVVYEVVVRETFDVIVTTKRMLKRDISLHISCL
jgi:hypothetical protein